MAYDPNVVNVSNCGSDERNAYSGGQARDQTGKEWAIRPWSVYRTGGWNCVLRHPDPQVRNMIMDMAIQAANNDAIGYDQLQRETFWYELQKVNYIPANITADCEADCSSGVCAIVKGVGYRLNRPELQSIPITSTYYMRDIFAKAGFQVLTDPMYLTTSDNLVCGDVMLSDQHHTNIVVTSNTSLITPVFYDISQLTPYIMLLDRHTRTAVNKKIVDAGVSGAVLEAGHLYNSDRSASKVIYNPRLDTQIAQLTEFKLPYGLIWYSHAANLSEAKQEANWFSYTIRSHHPQLGVWVACQFPDVNSIQTNNSILTIYRRELEDIGYANQIGLYGTRAQLKKLTLSTLKDNWAVWIVDPVSNVTDIQRMMDAKFFDVGV